MTREKYYKKRAIWVQNVAKQFRNAEKTVPQTVGAVVIGNRVAVINLDTAAIGVATCSSSDNFDLDTGLAIAYARMLGFGVPDYVINEYVPVEKKVCVSTLKAGQRFKYDDMFYHFCGKRDPNKWGETTYAVYNETKGEMDYFYSVEDHGMAVTLID